ncbi:MAG: MMPL/RND family transporter [Thermoplasmata archaeon]
MHSEEELHQGRGPRMFRALGRWIVRHPWYPVAFWVAVLVITLPFLPLLGSVTNNSATTLSSNSPSGQAAAEMALLFPNTTGAPSSSLILIVGSNVTDAYAQRAVLNLTMAIENDSALRYVRSVGSIYSSYSHYLAGQAGATWTLDADLRRAVNESAALLWGPPADFYATWRRMVDQNTSAPPSDSNYPAYVATQAQFNGSTAPYERAVLKAVYSGYNGSNAGFNGTLNCASENGSAAQAACLEGAARKNLPPFIAAEISNPTERIPGLVVLTMLGLFNYTEAAPIAAAVQAATPGFLAPYPMSWVQSVTTEFGTTPPSPSALLAFAQDLVVHTTLAHEPLPVPPSLQDSWVNSAGTATLIQVGFRVSDSYTDGSGASPVFQDVATLQGLRANVLHRSDPAHRFTSYQTGPAALNQDESTVLSSSLALVLPLTLGTLLIITMLYFRSPLTPLVTFAGIGTALAIGLGGLVLLATLFGHVDTTAITLETTFVLGVGTDYSVFIVARYREELVAGRSREEAVVRATTWAGQSVATSGATAVLATLALAFSGVSLLSQWGMVLSLAILITVLLSLTLVPAALRLLGPRIFWPTSGARFERHAAAVRDRLRGERTYFFRAGRLSQRRPRSIVALILLVSIPLGLIALSVPISYDFYRQLPSGSSATDGLSALGQQFGPGFAFPSTALLTFQRPLVTGTTVNATEFSDVANLTQRVSGVPGVARVQSLVGPGGAPLSDWLEFGRLPPAVQLDLHQLVSTYVGLDGRTVLIAIQTNASGLSVTAIQAINSVATSVQAYAQDHPALERAAYAGGAPATRDLAQQTSQATLRLIGAVSVGLFIVLAIVLRSWILPLMAVGTIGLSILWSWALTDLTLRQGFGLPLFFFVPTVLFILILGLGIDYNIFLLTRVREERMRGRSSSDAAVNAVGRTGGIITAAAIILASAFAILSVGNFTILRAIGFSVAVAVVLDAMVVRTYLVPAALQLLGDRAWGFFRRGIPTGTKGAPPPTPPPP